MSKTQRNMVASMGGVAIKNHFMSKCQPEVSTKDIFYCSRPFPFIKA